MPCTKHWTQGCMTDAQGPLTAMQQAQQEEGQQRSEAPALHARAVRLYPCAAKGIGGAVLNNGGAGAL